MRAGLAVVGISLMLAAGLTVMVAPSAVAHDAPSYDKGILLSMDSSTCGTAEKDGKTLAGEIIGTDSSHKATEQVLCQEYVLQGDRIVYRIRPEDAKHPILLPVGEMVEFRIHKDKLYLFDPEGDHKERSYSVVSMQVRQDVKDARNVQP
ncbi:MAG: hypothetical protein WA581_05775 [Candidatus Acidiferrales bacterium]